jgi:GH15 family glucan-1,4-alpha-glucosidase
VTQLIEDYAIVGDTQTAALIGRDGSVDWLCVPRFDSGSCFARLLGDADHGRWLIAPEDDVEVIKATRTYRPGTLVLETELTTSEGVVRVVEWMPPRQHHPRMVRLVQGVSGEVRMQTELIVRFEYGDEVPWVRAVDRGIRMIAGPNALCLETGVPLEGRNRHTEGHFVVKAGEEASFTLSWHRSHLEPPEPLDTHVSLEETTRYWTEWSKTIRQVHGPWEDTVRRSLITLKALTYDPTGGIVAAATTSLPEAIGGVRNWDYRYCWVRDATLTLDALIEAGCRDEAEAWMNWLVRAAAGAPEQLQIMYGAGGERRLSEFVVDWLPGYEGSAPVRIGNAASGQFQLDVYGELMDAVSRARNHKIKLEPVVWDLQLALMQFVTDHWQDPDDGIWEVRGPQRHFTHSKVMAWVAFDRAVEAVEKHGLEGPVTEWRKARGAVHDEVCKEGYSADRKAFTQYYGAKELDASVLMIPLVGFLPADDPRVVSTVELIQEELLVDGFVLRYQNTSGVDGLPGTEGAFLPCTFWLADCLTQMGRVDEAEQIFSRLVALANDVGLLSEEYDPKTSRLLGNFPQAFTHVGLINTARNLTNARSGKKP